MNKRSLFLIGFFVLQFFLSIIHLILIDFLPSPLNHFNFALTFLILYISISIDPRDLWQLLPFIWFQELFSSLPFGVNALALLFLILSFNLILITIFSNRSLPTIILSSIFFVILYRFLLWLIAELGHLLFSTEIININLNWFQNLGWEILFTTTISSLTYFLLSFFLKRLRPEYITAIQKDYEQKRYFR